MPIRPCLAALLACALLGMPAAVRSQSETPAPIRLATGHLANVVALPLYFLLYRVHLPAGRHTSYQGASAMLYDLAGAPAVAIDGGEGQPLAAGAGTFIASGQSVTISAAATAPSDLLLFILTHRPNQKPPLDRPAIVKELHRTGDPLPGLQAGSYEFSLARLTFPARMPAAPAAYCAGAALDYVLAGTGALTADGKTEAMSAEMALSERFGWVHSWANPGATPLVVLQAGITREGEPLEHPAAGK